MSSGVRAETIGADAEDVESTVVWHPSATGVPASKQSGFTDPVGAAANRIVAGRFRIMAPLGRGGMGGVWLAEDEVLERHVALKQLTERHPEEGLDALGEARAAARITHPGVVRVYDVLLSEHGDWIVMEPLSGTSLSQMLRDRGRLRAEEVTRIALQLLSALQALSQVDLVHRDVKPGNVQLCEGDRVVLTDFGLSSRPGQLGGLRNGTVTGSLPYLAPETIVDGHFGPPSDLYALGVTLYTAIEGHQPFDTSTPVSFLDSVLSEAPAPTRHAGALRVVLDGLLEKDPAQRMDAARARRCLQELSLTRLISRDRPTTRDEGGRATP
jgi:serine/threonine protein kinase